jgi:hypothetical protein
VAGVDFRLPTEEELDALEAFQLSLGRSQELALPLPLKETAAKRGQEIFLDNRTGKCNLCHANAGATADFGGGSLGNANFDTGVEDLPDHPARRTGEKVPHDDGFGSPGDGTFNTPPLVEAADSGPFFHNNAIETIEGAVAFYAGEAFNNSAAGQALGGIELDGTQIVAVAAFLRAINALENNRQSTELLVEAGRYGFFQHERAKMLIDRAMPEIRDGIRVLAGAGLHPRAVQSLEEAARLARKARKSYFGRQDLIRRALHELESARAELLGAEG